MKNRKRDVLLLVGTIALTMLLAACGGGGGGEDAEPTVNPAAQDDEGVAIPTPLPTTEVGEQSVSAAKDTPEATWNSYLPDSIAEQVKNRRQIIDLLERYENPDVTGQRLESLATNITLVEDRTAWNTNQGAGQANSFVDYDVQVTYANGDTETLTCRYNVAQEFDSEDGVWYILNPAALQVFADCT